MAIQRESTEYLFVGISGDAPSVDQELAFLEAGMRPTEMDWETAILVESGHPLFDDASALASGDYFLAILIGDYDTNPFSLSPGDYQIWVRLTDDPEQPVRIAPATLEVL